METLQSKILSMLLILTMLCSVLPLAVSAVSREATALPEGTKAISLPQGISAPGSQTRRGETYAYVLVNSAKRLTDGEYLIVASATGTYAKYGYYAMTTKEDSYYSLLQGLGQGFSTLPFMLNLDSSLYSTFAWKVKGNAQQLTLQTPSGGYLTSDDDTTALSLSNSGSQWRATYSAEKKAFVFDSNGRYLALRDDVDAVCDNKMSGFSNVASATGDVYMHVYKRVNTTELKEITLYHSLNLASDITMNYIVEKQQFAGFEELELELTVPVYEGNTLVALETRVLTPVENGDFYYFTLNGMTAVQMNDIIQGVIYGQREGIEYITETDYYSIGTYAYNQMAKDGSGTALRKVCAELLRYGSKLQTYKGYRTNALVDANMTEEQRAYLTDLESVKFGSSNTVLNDLAEPAVTWAGKGLDMQSKVALRMIVDLSNYRGTMEELSVRVSYIDLEGEEITCILRDCVVYREEENQYAFNFDGLCAAELRTVVSAAAYCGETRVSPTLCYSVDTYGNGKKGALLEACQALVAYSDAALEYFVS